MSKKWLITAVLSIVLGVGIFAAAVISAGGDFTRIGTGKYETNTYEITEEFNEISVITDTADVVFAPSNDTTCKAVCYEREKVKHSVSVANGVLSLNVEDTREWYDYIGINFDTQKITVYLPKTEYASLTIKGKTGDIRIAKEFSFENVDVGISTGDVDCYASVTGALKIRTSTGDVFVENATVGSLVIYTNTGDVDVSIVDCVGDVSVVVTTGDVELYGITCEDFFSQGSTGEISLENVIATGTLHIVRSTGDVDLDCVDAAEMCVKTDTGDVEGRLLSEKVFITQTDTGRVSVPNTASGGRCEITTDTGDIKIRIR